MKRSQILIALLLTVLGLQAFANDGGMAAIKVSEIKMRSTEIKNGKLVETPILNPSFKIYITGEEASKLQQILPSTSSVITATQPELKQQYDDTFKSLGLYNKAVKRNGQILVASKTMVISCSDGDLSMNADGKAKITKKGQSECVITINRIEDDMDAADYFGDAQTFSPTCHN